MTKRNNSSHSQTVATTGGGRFVEKMSRVRIKLNPLKPITTTAMLRRADWANTSSEDARYCIFEEGDQENRWPTDDDGSRFNGLPWPRGAVIPTAAGERLHILTKGSSVVIEGHEAAL